MGLKEKFENHPLVAGILLMVAGGGIVFGLLKWELLPYAPKQELKVVQDQRDELIREKQKLELQIISLTAKEENPPHGENPQVGSKTNKISTGNQSTKNDVHQENVNGTNIGHDQTNNHK